MWNEPWVWWLGLGFTLLVIEMLSGTLFFLCLAPAAFATATVAWLVQDTSVQWICFASAGCLALFGWRRLRRKATSSAHDPAGLLNNRTRHLVGRQTVLAEPVVNGRSRVNIDDSWWQAACAEPLPAGTPVRVTAVHDMILTIEKNA